MLKEETYSGLTASTPDYPLNKLRFDMINLPGARFYIFALTILFLICSTTAKAQQSWAGVWRGGNDPYYLWVGVDFNNFKAKWEELAKQNLRLIDLETYEDGGQRKFSGVWRGGNDAYYLWVGVDWNNFKSKWEELAKQNLRLIDLETYVENGQRKYAGVWRAGGDAYYLWAGVDWDNFKTKWDELSKQNLRLVDLETYIEGNQRKYIGAWRAGNDGHYLWVGVDWNNFKAKWEELAKQNLRLTVFKTYMDGNQRKYAGVWRAGGDAYYLWAGVDFENFKSKWNELASKGLRLINMTTYAGCGGDCANQVVANSAYNYGITGHNTVYHWPVDQVSGQKYARLSAITFSAAPFTLPFSNQSVKRWNGWLYGAGSWHHAHDYAIDLNQTFEVRAAAAGKVVFIGWDNWSGNTVVVSHDVGGVQDAYRTIYMHLRNGPANDCNKAWSQTINDPNIGTAAKDKLKAHLNATGCPQNVANRNPTQANWGTNAQKIVATLNQQLTAGQIIGYAGDTGPGGNGSNNASTNMHLHIFFTRRDPSDNQFYFFDPYGIYGIPSCYPSGTTDSITGACARYPNAWKGGHPQYP